MLFLKKVINLFKNFPNFPSFLKVAFIVLGFVIMVLVQLLEGEHDHHHHSEENHSVCEIDPKEYFKNISTSLVNVTCIDEDLKIL